MSPWKKTLPFVASLLSCVATTVVPAAPKLNLDRLTPVPETEQIPVMDFFRAPLFTNPQINPAGTHIAALVTGNVDKHRLLIYELATQKVDTLEGAADKDIYAVNWLNDQRLVYFVSTEKLYGLGLMAVEVGKMKDTYALAQYMGARLVAIPPGDRTRPLVWMSYDALESEKDLGVAKINSDIKTGSFINLTRAANDLDMMAAIKSAKDNNDRHIIKTYPQPKEGITTGYLADKDGQLQFAFTGDNGYFTMHHLNGGEWEKSPVDLETVGILCSGNQPGELFVRAPREEGKPQAIRVLDGITGQMGGVIFQDNAYDFNGWPYRDPVSHDVVGFHFERSGPKTVWFDESYRGIQKVLDGYFPGQVVRIIGSDTASRTFLVTVFSDRQPPIYNWVNFEKRTAGLIKSSKPWIDPKRMQPMNILKYKTKDGKALDSYLTLPAGASAEHPAPLVVLPHGGPWVRDSWGFDDEVQFLASRGYAVLQPNYRGSPGYDWMFPEEDQYDFLKMHEDVTQATKAALATGLVDSTRVAIMGASFGGYLALSGVVHEPSLYRCAVTIAGVFDWRKLMQQEKYYQYDSPWYARLVRKLGDPKRDTSKFDAISPSRHVDQVRVPVFVSHGKDDRVADFEQSKLLVSELVKNHVPHETYFVGGEGHGMAHLTNEVELYTRIEAFLAKNLAPTQPAATAAGSP